MMFPQRNTLEQMCIYKTRMFPLRGNTIIKLGLTDGKNEVITSYKKKKKRNIIILSLRLWRDARRRLPQMPKNADKTQFCSRNWSCRTFTPADNHRAPATAANASKRQSAPPPPS